MFEERYFGVIIRIITTKEGSWNNSSMSKEAETPTSESIDITIPFLTKEFLTNVLKKDLDSELEVLRYKTSIGSTPGENYGSCFHKIRVLVKSDTNLLDKGRSYVSSGVQDGTYDIFLVSKTIPTNEFFLEVFNSKVTFQKESDFYSLLIPAYESLCTKEGIQPVNFFPHCLYHDFVEEGENAIIILEDLTFQGYSTENREKGVTLAHAKLVLHCMALMHAMSIALKIRDPKVYNKIAPIVAKNFREGQDQAKVMHTIMAPMTAKVMDTIKKFPDLSPEILEKVLGYLTNDMLILNPPREPFAAISHMDLWTNNMMFKDEESVAEPIICHSTCSSGKNPSHLKLLDFQMTAIRSPVHDIVFFLYTSVPKIIRSKHFKELLEFYCNEFRKALKTYGCSNQADDITLEWFNDEIIDNGPAILSHVLFMLVIVYSDKSEKHVFSMSNDDLLSGRSISATSETYISETHSTIIDFISNCWI